MAFDFSKPLYPKEHAEIALRIMREHLPKVTRHEEYDELIEILEDEGRWSEAHAQFGKIRSNITLPSDRRGEKNLDTSFIYIAENAAKTAYNCTVTDAPFDEDSFEWLVRAEKEFLERSKAEKD